MEVYEFGSSDPLEDLCDAKQGQYLRCYLADLGARSVVREPSYFDRDYLDEFGTFYATVARPLPNICSRLHFFDRTLTTESLRIALGGGRAAETLRKAYLGFCVIRPLAHAPFGRTVVRWYPDDDPKLAGTPRVVEPSRTYRVSLAGLILEVRGLAWQQQDGAIGRCATIALWSLLHSSAFDDHHAIPTTATVTRYGYANERSSGHVFPASDGMEVQKIVEAIARAGLAPRVLESDSDAGFRREKFASAAVMIRSGFPVLVSGYLEHDEYSPREGHVICATGFRDASPELSDAGPVLQDREIGVLYAHDDNLGPNVRLNIEEDSEGLIRLRPRPPKKRYKGKRLPDPVASYPALVPQELIVGVHELLRMSADELQSIAMIMGANLRRELRGDVRLPVTATTRFARVATYLSEILPGPFGGDDVGIGCARMDLIEQLPPMSLFVGVVRLGYGVAPIADVLLDTSERPHPTAAPSLRVERWRAFGTLLFNEDFAPLLTALSEQGIPFGRVVTASKA